MNIEGLNYNLWRYKGQNCKYLFFKLCLPSKVTFYNLPYLTFSRVYMNDYRQRPNTKDPTFMHSSIEPNISMSLTSISLNLKWPSHFTPPVPLSSLRSGCGDGGPSKLEGIPKNNKDHKCVTESNPMAKWHQISLSHKQKQGLEEGLLHVVCLWLVVCVPTNPHLLALSWFLFKAMEDLAPKNHRLLNFYFFLIFNFSSLPFLA